MSDDLQDDLPVDIDAETGGDEEGTELWKWLAGAGGLIVGIWALTWLFRILVGVVGFLAYWGLIALLAYGAYRGVAYLLSDDSSSQVTGDEQVALPDDIDVERELETELGSLESGGLDDADLEGELEGISIDDVDLETDRAEVSVETSSERNLDDDELERKFAELEREMNES